MILGIIGTHSDPVNFRIVSLAVVSIKRFLAHGQRCLDRDRVLGVDSTSCQDLVDAIHGRDDRGDVWCTVAREKKGSVLENLQTMRG